MSLPVRAMLPHRGAAGFPKAMAVNRVVNFSDAQQWATLFDELRDLKGPYEIQITKKRRRKATPEQFGYYYAVLLPRAKHWLIETQADTEDADDYTDVDADLWLKNYLRGIPVVNKKTGEVMNTIAPLKRHWNTKQMAEFVTDVMDLLTKNDVPFPLPDKNWREKLVAA